MENMHTDARVERVNNWILFLWNTPECSHCKVRATEFELVTKVASSRYEYVKKKKKYIYIYIYIIYYTYIIYLYSYFQASVLMGHGTDDAGTAEPLDNFCGICYLELGKVFQVLKFKSICKNDKFLAALQAFA